MSATATVTNYFTFTSAAERYARGRPSGHGRALAAARPYLEEHLPFARALDVACGTGHSTIALVPYAGAIIGVDASAAMLSQAPQHPAISYQTRPAEELDFGDHSFDLVTVASAYHWLDHDRFLAAAARVLRPGGFLMVYGGGSGARLPIDDAEAWLKGVFHPRFPKVARHEGRVSDEEAGRHGLTLVAAKTFASEHEHTLDSYVELLTTRSNVICAVDARGENLAEVKDWIRRNLEPFFAGREPLRTQRESRFQLFRSPAAQV